MDQSNARFKQCFLGNLSAEECAEIDLRVIADETITEDLALAESDLIEDYLEGSLSDEELELFRSNFLTSAARQQQVHEISLLKNYALTRIKTEKQTGESENNSAFRLGDFFKTYLRPLGAGAVVVAAAVLIGVVWQGYFTGSTSPLEKEYAELNKKDLGNLAALNEYSAISLISGSFRDANSAITQSSEKLTDTVLFRLALPAGSDDGTSFRFRIWNGSTPVFMLDDARSFKNPGGKEVRVLVPKSILRKGQYQIKLENAAKVDQLLTFGFSVE